MQETTLKQKIYLFTINAGIKVLSAVFPEYFAQDPLNPSDRYIECPFVISNLPWLPARVLDVGCSGSFFPLILSSFGYETNAIDIRNYSIINRIEYKNFKFFNVSIAKTNFPDNYFDAVTAVSTLEHIGLSGRYGVGQETPDSDKAAINEIGRILKPGGVFLLTIPFGKAKVLRPNCRIYDSNSIKNIINGLAVEKEEYFMQDRNDDWYKCDKEEAEVVDATIYRYPLCLLKLTKPL